MDNKFPGKDISQEDLKTKFPLTAKKKITTNLYLQLQELNLEVTWSQYLLDQIWLKAKI